MKTIQFYFTIFSFFMIMGVGSLVSVFIWAAIFALNFYIASKIWKNSTDAEAKRYTGAQWFEDKFGVNIWEEEE